MLNTANVNDAESGPPVSNQVEVLDEAETQMEAEPEGTEQIPCTQKRKRGRPPKKPEEWKLFYAMPTIKDWRTAIDFWHHGDTQSDTPALKTWSKEQIHGVTKADMMKRKKESSRRLRNSNASREDKYNRIKTIANEYERLGEEEFISTYRSFLNNQAGLRKAINQSRADSEETEEN
jgi:hypothetical protein